MECTLVIADTNNIYLDILKRSIARCPDFRIVGTASDGLQALELIQCHKPEIVLMDMLLPKVDGLCLLKAMQKMKKPPAAVCMSSFYSPASIEQARKNGASYYVCKPVEFQAMITILRELFDYRSTVQRNQTTAIRQDEIGILNRSVHDIMHTLGFSDRLSGSSYLAESVLIAHESPMKVRNLSAEIYQDLADRLHTSATSIERCMRTAIAAANENGALTLRLGEVPTNKRCIQYILNELHSLRTYG